MTIENKEFSWNLIDFREALGNKIHMIVQSEGNTSLTKEDIIGFTHRLVHRSIEKGLRNKNKVKEKCIDDAANLLAQDKSKIIDIIRKEVDFYDKRRAERN